MVCHFQLVVGLGTPKTGKISKIQKEEPTKSTPSEWIYYMLADLLVNLLF